MRLYLIRHADAVDGADDATRPLSTRGRRQMRAIAKVIRPLALKVHVIWHSGLVRARQSAEALEEVVSCAQGVVPRDGLAPADRPGTLAAELRRYTNDAMIVGHEPHLGRLASKLLAGKGSAGLLAIRKGAALCLQRDEDYKWRLEWMLTPELAGSK